MAEENILFSLTTQGASWAKVIPMCTQRGHCAIRACERMEGRGSAGALLKSRVKEQEFNHGANGLR